MLSIKCFLLQGKSIKPARSAMTSKHITLKEQFTSPNTPIIKIYKQIVKHHQ